MSGYPPSDPRVAASPFAIGDPGRTARERQAGPPGNRGAVPDTELSAAVLPGLVMRAATVRGLQHRALGEPRQDAFAIGHRAIAGGTARAIAVVCDGVGSLGRSEEAAMLVSRCLARLSADGLEWPESFKRANEALRELVESAAAEGTGDDDAAGMATTAVALSAHREGDDWVGETAWVGDSPVWHLSDDACWTRLTDAIEDDDDFHSGAVRPLPSADGACSVKQFRVSGGALFVMSDGVGNPLAWSPAVQGALADWWASPPDPFTFAAQVGFARKTHIDDRTVVGIWLVPDSDEPEAGAVRERDLGALTLLAEGRSGEDTVLDGDDPSAPDGDGR